MPGPTVRNTRRGLVSTRGRGRVIRPSAPAGRRITPVSPSRAPIATAPVHGRPTRERRAQRVSSALHRVQRAFSSKKVSAPGVPPLIAHLDSKIGRKYGIPPSVLASQQRQESGFNPDAVSSAAAFGVSQFIPSTADAYGVKPGHSKSAVKSQIKGQAKYLSDLHFKDDPQGALSSYSGGYSAGSYNNPVLAGAKDFKGLDRGGRPTKPKPKDLKILRRAGVPIPGRSKEAAKAPAKTPPVKPEVAHRFKKIEKAANSVAGVPYVLGGGHGSVDEKHPSSLDCSGAVSRVLHAAGVLDHPLVSGDMGSVLKPGPGAVTVYYNSGHTFMKIGNKFWGTSVGDSGSGGLGEHPAPSSSYLAEYSVGHVPGLGKKAAAAMGVKLSAGGSASSGSSGGGSTTASFSHGVIKAAPGFSNHPIKAANATAERKKKLGRVDAAYSDTASQSAMSSGTSHIAARHGKPVV